MQLANLVANDKKLEEIQLLDGITNPKTQKAVFRKKLSQYNRPMWIVFLGFFFEIIKGLISTTFGALIMKNFFSILNNYNDNAKMRKDVDFWSLMKFITAIVAFISCFFSKVLFSRVGENITLNVRSDLYTQILKK